jgi:dienelactone hydrolase
MKVEFFQSASRIIAIVIISVLSFAAALARQTGQRPDNQDLPVKTIPRAKSIQKEVSFQTQDGWRISGTYTIPLSYKQGEKLPAALLLHSPMHSQIVWGVYPGWIRIQESIATLRIDLRGRGKSQGPIAFVDFNQAQRESVAFDISAALDFLSTQPEVDQRCLGIVAEGFSAGPALIAAGEDPRARVFVLISGLLSQKALDLLSSDFEKPALFIVSKEDGPSLAALTKAYASVKHPKSDIWIQEGLGTGVAMASVWRNRHPDQPEEKAIDFQAGDWLVRQLHSLGHFSEIKLQTADGWILHANFGLPDNTRDGQLVPGVLLLPTALSDRTSFHNLEQLLVVSNIAVLNLDWRGIGKSINKGTLIEQTASIFTEALIDVEAGYKFLSSQKGVDPERIGILGGAVGGKLAMTMTKRNPKVKAIALLSPITKPEELANDRETIAAIAQPILLVTSDGLGESTKKLAGFVAKGNRNTVMTYSGGLLGYALFSLDDKLERAIAEWFKLQLGG